MDATYKLGRMRRVGEGQRKRRKGQGRESSQEGVRGPMEEPGREFYLGSRWVGGVKRELIPVFRQKSGIRNEGGNPRMGSSCVGIGVEGPSYLATQASRLETFLPT